MRVLITGADGFIGRDLAQTLLARGGVRDLVLTDRQMASAPAGAIVRMGDLTDGNFVADLTGDAFDLVYHLASMPGSLAEAGHGTSVNLTAPIALANAVARGRQGARFVFASSIAIYGAVTEMITPSTPPEPQLSYGAQKWMVEIFLTDLTRRGALSAISLRLPGIVARPVVQTGHGSAFMSLLFHKIRAGEDYDCPVPQTASCWWLSRPACVAALIHAAGLPKGPTVCQLPVQHLTVQTVAKACAEVIGKNPQIRWGNDARLTALFGAMPALDARDALQAGFAADLNAHDLARNAIAKEIP